MLLEEICPRILCSITAHRWHVIGPDVTLCFRCGLVRDDSPDPKTVEQREAHLKIKERLRKVALAHDLELHD